MLTKILLIAASGAVGTLARFGLSGLVQTAYKGNLPLGTFVVNIIGCLLFGFIWTISEEKLTITSEARLIILVGFMGAFTT
ncbi:MAG: CrcB family protein, partial [Deltaproteobacteria bacterium]|nr:CrcB family protein [Deltaproteobacteria bacterium]